MIHRRSSRTVSLRALSSRHWAPRLTLLFILTFGATVMVLSRSNSAFVSSVRSTMTDVLVPVLSVAAKPVDAVRDAKLWLSDMADMRSQNLALKNHVQSLTQWQAIANSLQAENDALRKLISIVPGGKTSYVAARVVSESGGPYVRTALINAGAEDGVAANQAVIGGEGLVGRVVESGQTSARVLLLTDINSRVPVMGEISRERSIATGNNSRELTLDYVEAGSKMEAGERIVTSGDGGVFPPGIPVGVISGISGNIVTVKPLADWARMEYVSVVAYEF